jgi:hypothetical protein
MARSTRASRLETRTARLKSAVRKKPYFVAIGPGVGLGYRRNKTAGSWVVRAADGKGGNWTQAFAVADDFEDANGTDVFNFWQAQERARAVARGGRDATEDSGKPVTVAQIIDRYETDLRVRGGDVYNAQRVRVHMPEMLARDRGASCRPPGVSALARWAGEEGVGAEHGEPDLRRLPGRA